MKNHGFADFVVFEVDSVVSELKSADFAEIHRFYKSWNHEV